MIKEGVMATTDKLHNIIYLQVYLWRKKFDWNGEDMHFHITLLKHIAEQYPLH